MAAVSKDGRGEGRGLHGSRRPLRCLLTMRSESERRGTVQSAPALAWTAAVAPASCVTARCSVVAAILPASSKRAR